MTKVRFHGPIAGFSGAMGEMVFMDRGQQTVAYMKTHYVLSEAQLHQQERFGDAALYAKAALADPIKREFYETVAKEKDLPAFALAVADYLNVPSFKPLDLSQYKGKVGDPILIRAVDDLGLVSVEVAIVAIDGSAIERGMAVETGVRSGYWVYTATAPVVPGANIFIELVGIDHTGKKVKMTESPTVGVDE